MRLLKADVTTKSPVEFAVIEATNNRIAVRELRRVLRRAVKEFERLGNYALAAYCGVILANTTPQKLKGIK